MEACRFIEISFRRREEGGTDPPLHVSSSGLPLSLPHSMASNRNNFCALSFLPLVSVHPLPSARGRPAYSVDSQLYNRKGGKTFFTFPFFSQNREGRRRKRISSLLLLLLLLPLFSLVFVRFSRLEKEKLFSSSSSFAFVKEEKERRKTCCRRFFFFRNGKN